MHDGSLRKHTVTDFIYHNCKIIYGTWVSTVYLTMGLYMSKLQIYILELLFL